MNQGSGMASIAIVNVELGIVAAVGVRIIILSLTGARYVGFPSFLVFIIQFRNSAFGHLRYFSYCHRL